MENKYARMFEILGEVVVAALMGAGLTMLLAESAGQPVSAYMVYSYAGLTALVLLGLSWSRASGWITLVLLITAALIAALAGWRPLDKLEAILDCVYTHSDMSPHANSLAALAMIMLLVASYIIAHQPTGVYLMSFAAIATLAIGWYYGETSASIHILPVLAALSAMYARASGVSARHLKPLLSLSLLSAILACLLVPAQGARLESLDDLAHKALRFMIRTFNIENDNLEERRSFTIATNGWFASKDAFGGPASPSKDDIMLVNCDYTSYLRGAIRYVYNNRAWVDEDNLSKAGKIKRYMLGGIEGIIYSSEYEKAFDLDKSRAARYFTDSAISVTMLADNPYWSIYSPNRTSDVSLAGDAHAYFNNVGELFANRQLIAGDAYTLNFDALAISESELPIAVEACAGGRDDAYAGVLLLNRELPAGIDPRLYELTYEIISGAQTPYEKAAYIRDWLRASGTYTLNADYVPGGRDMASYFVLDSLSGYCVHFASAMAVMARIAGLPARYVEGYLVTPDDSGARVVTGEDAHAWAEVYFEGFGWLTFDATPGRDGASDIGGPQGDSPAFPPDRDPAPTPTPAITPPPSDHTGGAPTPSPAPDEALGDDIASTPTPAPNTHYEPDARPPAASDDGGGGSFWLGALMLILALAALCLVALLARAWLMATQPANMMKKAKNADDKLMCWYRAALTALSSAGTRYENGETPESFAARALVNGACTEDFIAFSREVARCRYSQRLADQATYALAQRAYKGITSRMRPAAKIKWLTKRLTRGVGPLHPVP